MSHALKPYDAVIIGGGHNGLVCACYLAKAKFKVKIIEKRNIVGGAAVTESLMPGFRNSVASYTVSLLNPKIIRDLNLYQHGLEIIERPMANFLPLSNHSHLIISNDLAATQLSLRQFSKRDAKRLPDYYIQLQQAADVLREWILQTPPKGTGHWSDMWKAFQLGRTWQRLPIKLQRFLHDLLTKSAADILDAWFESDPIKAAFGFDAVVGNFASPYTPGSAYVLLHHVIGEINGKKGCWGHAMGGMGAITQAMQKEALSLGVEISTGIGVKQVMIEKQRAIGVILDDGSEIYAKKVVSNLNPKLLYLNLIEPMHLEADFLFHMRGYRCQSATFRMNIALNELPDFTCLPGKNCQPHHLAGIIIAPSLQYMEQAYFDARQTGWAQSPIIEILIPSTIDQSLAPTGKHVASLFCQHFHPELPQQQHWDNIKPQIENVIINTVNQYAPNFKDSILGKMSLSPLDLERRFGLIGGDIFHGALGLDQLYSARPILGYGDYRTPLQGLYICGSGTHPGGGVTGVPGHNAAKEIIRDGNT